MGLSAAAPGLWNLHETGYAMEPKPLVTQAFKLNLGKKTEAVLEVLRRLGHEVEGDTVAVRYKSGSDPYIGSEAADVEDEIFEIAIQCGVEQKELLPGIVRVNGLGPQSTWRSNC